MQAFVFAVHQQELSVMAEETTGLEQTCSTLETNVNNIQVKYAIDVCFVDITSYMTEICSLVYYF